MPAPQQQTRSAECGLSIVPRVREHVIGAGPCLRYA